MTVIEYEPELVEEAVLVFLRGHPEERAFRRQRDRLYEVRDPEAREAAFRELHATWFAKLGLGRPIVQALEEQPSIGGATRGCRIAPARARQEEGAELFVRPATAGERESDRRWVVVRLRPEAFGAPERLVQLLRHELTHIADMLDPRFGYEPHLPQPAAGPAHERLLRDRYGVLWDALIDGRLARLGRAPASRRAGRLRDFVRTFPMLGPRTEEAFARFFDGTEVAHTDLVAFATKPDPIAAPAASDPRPPARHTPGGQAPGPHPGERCPLCRFPTHAFEADPARLPGEVVAGIRSDFPAWDPAQGLCRQCADLYRARSLSASGADMLPAGRS